MRRLVVLGAALCLWPALLSGCAPDLAADLGTAARQAARFLLRPRPEPTVRPALSSAAPGRLTVAPAVTAATPATRGLVEPGASATATPVSRVAVTAATDPVYPVASRAQAPWPDGPLATPASDRAPGGPTDPPVDPTGAGAAVAATVIAWPTPTEPPTATPDAFARLGVPIRLEVPSIGVSAIVEQVGITRDRAMGVPSTWDRVAWFKLGFRPGEAGNAVMAGHLDTSSGGPAVFWNLDKLAPGDEVIVHYSNGDRLVFVVQGSAVYDYDASGPSIEQIFGPAQTANLNLITCNGAWDRGRATYTKRLVVFSTLAQERTVRAGDPATYE